jgi:hypothetical protein
MVKNKKMKTAQEFKKKQEEKRKPIVEAFANDILKLIDLNLDEGTTWISYNGLSKHREIWCVRHYIDKIITPIIKQNGWKHEWVDGEFYAISLKPRFRFLNEIWKNIKYFWKGNTN